MRTRLRAEGKLYSSEPPDVGERVALALVCSLVASRFDAPSRG
jgi:hypothetical protein